MADSCLTGPDVRHAHLLSGVIGCPSSIPNHNVYWLATARLVQAAVFPVNELVERHALFSLETHRSMFFRTITLPCLIAVLTIAACLAAPAQPAPLEPDAKSESQRLIDHRQLDSAEKIIVRQMMDSPRDPDWITQLAEVRLGQNRTREALQLIHSANLLAGMTATRAMLISLAYSQAGYMDRAEGPIRKAIELEPGNATAHYFLARLLYTDNRFDESI